MDTYTHTLAHSQAATLSLILELSQVDTSQYFDSAIIQLKLNVREFFMYRHNILSNLNDCLCGLKTKGIVHVMTI